MNSRATSHRRNARTIEHDWIQAMSRMINALFSRSPRSAYESLSIRFNGIGVGQSARPVAAGEWCSSPGEAWKLVRA